MGENDTMDLEFTITNQVLKRTDNNKLANWSDNYLRLVFSFETEDWSELVKYCLIRANGEVYRMDMENNTVILPVGILTSDRIGISLYGMMGEDYRVTTNIVKVYMNDSGYVPTGSDIPDIDDIYTIIDSKASVTYVDERLDLKADTTYVNTELAKKSDKTHKHTKSDITDFPTNVSAFTNDSGYLTQHQSLANYYTKAQVEALIDGIQNQIGLAIDKTIVQTDETLNLTVNLKKDGFPKGNAKIDIYEVN